METHESRKEKAKPLKPLRCAICGDEGHSPVECRKVLNYDHSYPANHPSASNFLWWLEHGANGFSQYNPTPLNHTEINWAKIVRPSMPQNQEKTEVSFWPGRRNDCIVSSDMKILFADKFFRSNNFRFFLSIILMRVFGIQTRPQATQIMNKFKTMKNDTEIIEELTKLFPNKKNSNTDIKIQSDKSVVRDIFFSWHFHLNDFATNYLDIGCGRGTMTEALGLLLRLDDDCVHGIDIMSHESLELKNFSLFDGVNIPFNDNEFDFLSIFQVLHHVESDKLNMLLSDVRRVCQNGGYLFLKEHNCDSDEFCQLTDIEHVLYSISRTTFSNPGLYRCKNEWKNLLSSYGFEMIKEYSRKNEPTNSYYSLYICNK